MTNSNASLLQIKLPIYTKFEIFKLSTFYCTLERNETIFIYYGSLKMLRKIGNYLQQPVLPALIFGI